VLVFLLAGAWSQRKREVAAAPTVVAIAQTALAPAVELDTVVIALSPPLALK
jgi:hypothetical protein